MYVHSLGWIRWSCVHPPLKSRLLDTFTRCCAKKYILTLHCAKKHSDTRPLSWSEDGTSGVVVSTDPIKSVSVRCVCFNISIGHIIVKPCSDMQYRNGRVEGVWRRPWKNCFGFPSKVELFWIRKTVAHIGKALGEIPPQALETWIGTTLIRLLHGFF